MVKYNGELHNDTNYAVYTYMYVLTDDSDSLDTPDASLNLMEIIIRTGP